MGESSKTIKNRTADRGTGKVRGAPENNQGGPAHPEKNPEKTAETKKQIRLFGKLVLYSFMAFFAGVRLTAPNLGDWFDFLTAGWII